MDRGFYYGLYSTGKPGPPVNVRISHYTPDSVTLQWDPPEYNGVQLLSMWWKENLGAPVEGSQKRPHP